MGAAAGRAAPAHLASPHGREAVSQHSQRALLPREDLWLEEGGAEEEPGSLCPAGCPALGKMCLVLGSRSPCLEQESSDPSQPHTPRSSSAPSSPAPSLSPRAGSLAPAQMRR